MKREGYNHIIQGTGADVTKLAMISLDTNNPFGDLFFPILQVHDEVVAEIHDSILKEGEAFMIKQMVDAFQPFLGNIPAKVDSKISKRWTKS
jgi:DNA polymerase I-like protein with 3'-5' exonuclease and polymerase domains